MQKKTRIEHIKLKRDNFEAIDKNSLEELFVM